MQELFKSDRLLGETCMMMACMYGHKFSGVAFHGKQAQYYDRKAFEYGLAARHIPFGEMGIDFTQVQSGFTNPVGMRESFIRESKRLVSQGAEVILAACATVNAIIRSEKINEVDGALVMDCNAVLLKVTEGMAELSKSIGLNASRRLLFQRPERKALANWKRVGKGRGVACGARRPLRTLWRGNTVQAPCRRGCVRGSRAACQ